MSLAVVGVVYLLRTSSRDDDDEFLYGDSELKASSLSTTVAPPVIPSPGENHLLRHSFCILLVPTKYIRLFAHILLACASVGEPDE